MRTLPSSIFSHLFFFCLLALLLSAEGIYARQPSFLSVSHATATPTKSWNCFFCCSVDTHHSFSLTHSSCALLSLYTDIPSLSLVLPCYRYCIPCNLNQTLNALANQPSSPISTLPPPIAFAVQPHQNLKKNF
ncbi:hypothetical protein C8R43DRAFT_375884 [Mycena crocata]|nr:hypothetical protein C8R43DRAFT_375884 [Mycena crocata]